MFIPLNSKRAAARSPRFFPVIAICVWIFIVAACLTEVSAEWRAGVSRVVINPDEPVWMAGYAARTGPSEGSLVDLYARCTVLTDSASSKQFVIVTLDLIEIPDSLRELLVEVAEKTHKIKPEELLLNVSHTHGGPMVSAKTVADWGLEPVWGERAEKYVQTLVKRVDEVIGQAISKQVAATISYSHARCGFAMNRRLNTGGGFRLGVNPNGPVDHDVPLLKIESVGGELLGLVFGYACHNTALGPTRMFNGDYAGFAQRKLEANHWNTIALFLAGCGGDQDPAPRRCQEDAEQNGLALALTVEAALSAAPVPLEPSISSSLDICPLAFSKLPSREELETRANSGDGFVSRHAKNILKQWPNQGDHPEDYPLPIQVVVLGQKLTLITIGGEPVVDYAIRLKQELASDERPLWVAGYSNLVNAYVPSRRVLLEGGYEGTEAIIYQSLPSPFQLDSEERIIKSIHRQYDLLWGRSQPKQ
jgi:neutral ceramidase